MSDRKVLDNFVIDKAVKYEFIATAISWLSLSKWIWLAKLVNVSLVSALSPQWKWSTNFLTLGTFFKDISHLR